MRSERAATLTYAQTYMRLHEHSGSESWRRTGGERATSDVQAVRTIVPVLDRDGIK